MEKIALVTGANKGLGYECCKLLSKKGYTVILTSRNRKNGETALEQLKKEGYKNIFFEELDVTSEKNIDTAVKNILHVHKKIDILINNAGIFLDEGEDMKSMPMNIETISLEVIKRTLETNLYGPILLTQKILPLMKKHNFGRILNVSSGMGQLTGEDARYSGGGYPSYRISKTALNVFTRNLAFELKERNILVNSVCPGWCLTDMGGKEATRSAEQGAKGIVWAATETKDSGKFFRDGKEISW